MFKSIVSTNTFLIKIVCYVDGKASVHLRSSATIQYTDRKFKEDLLDAINFLCFVD